MIAISAPKPLEEAVKLHSAKTPIESILRSADWARVPLALRQRAQFSSGVESVRVLVRIQEYLSQYINLERNAMRVDSSTPGTYKMDRQKFIADIRELAISEGLTPVDESERGTLKDITSETRLDLIFRTQIGQAQGFAYWKQGQDTDVLDGFPAQELFRLASRKVPRDWQDRWASAGGQFYDGRMIALKTSPIWVKISRFGTPWPPFDFNSGMGLEEIDRAEAESLGLLKKGESVSPVEKDFNDGLEASTQGLPERFQNALKKYFGDQVEISGDSVKWSNN